MLLENEALGAEECSDDTALSTTHHEDLQQYAEFVTDFLAIVGEREKSFPHAYNLINTYLTYMLTVILKTRGIGQFFSQASIVGDITATFFANISLGLCRLLETGDWTFQQLYDAYMPWPRSKARAQWYRYSFR